jgi:hypothetical protein
MGLGGLLVSCDEGRVGVTGLVARGGLSGAQDDEPLVDPESDFGVSIVNFHRREVSGEYGVYFYTVALFSPSQACIVTQKRFRHFQLLHGALQRVLAASDLPRFPSRFFRTQPTERLVSLGEYLNALVGVLRRGGPGTLVARQLLLAFAGAYALQSQSRRGGAGVGGSKRKEPLQALMAPAAAAPLGGAAVGAAAPCLAAPTPAVALVASAPGAIAEGEAQLKLLREAELGLGASSSRASSRTPAAAMDTSASSRRRWTRA